MLRCAQVTKAL